MCAPQVADQELGFHLSPLELPEPLYTQYAEDGEATVSSPWAGDDCFSGSRSHVSLLLVHFLHADLRRPSCRPQTVSLPCSSYLHRQPASTPACLSPSKLGAGPTSQPSQLEPSSSGACGSPAASLSGSVWSLKSPRGSSRYPAQPPPTAAPATRQHSTCFSPMQHGARPMEWGQVMPSTARATSKAVCWKRGLECHCVPV